MTPSKEISADIITKTKDFVDFLNIAKNYCNFIETERDLTVTEFLRETQVHLITLYSLAKNLPSVNLQTDKDLDISIDDNAFQTLLKFIGERVPFSYYWVTLNPLDMNNSAEIGTGDLIDDLGDIYKDLKNAVTIFETDDISAKENATWKFKFDFDYHWGNHCMEAFSAIHHYLAENK